MGLLVLSWLGGAAQKTPLKEYEVKAVFLYNFTQFVEWPPAAFPDTLALTIGVVGNDPFGGFLDELVKDEQVLGRPIIIRRFRQAEAVADCHILFIGREVNAEPVLEAIQGLPVLTVGDHPAFIKKGGMVRFYTETNKIRLQIRPAAVRRAGLSISSKLLRLAQVVE